MSSVINHFVLAVSLSETGRGMTLCGLVLGVAFYLGLRYGRPPTDPLSKGQDDIMRWTAKPLIAIGLVGVVLWGVAALR